MKVRPGAEKSVYQAINESGTASNSLPASCTNVYRRRFLFGGAVSMSYIDFWRRWKDFSGRSTRYEYWTALFAHIFISFFFLIAGSTAIMFVFDLTSDETVHYVEIIYKVYGLVWIVPFISLTVRRYRDAGYTSKNFWKLFIIPAPLTALWLPSFDENKDSGE